MYIHASNRDSRDYFPSNTPTVFHVKLANRLELKGLWKIGVCDLVIGNVDVSSNELQGAATLLIACDICTGFIVNGIQTRVLRAIPIQKNFQKTFPSVIYVPIETCSLDTIEFRLVNGLFEEAVFKSGKNAVKARGGKDADAADAPADAPADASDDEDDANIGHVCMTLHLKYCGKL